MLIGFQMIQRWPEDSCWDKAEGSLKEDYDQCSGGPLPSPQHQLQQACDQTNSKPWEQGWPAGCKARYCLTGEGQMMVQGAGGRKCHIHTFRLHHIVRPTQHLLTFCRDTPTLELSGERREVFLIFPASCLLTCWNVKCRITCDEMN